MINDCIFHLKELIQKCKNLFSEGQNEIFLHCLGNAINRGINLVLTVVEDSNGTLDFEVNTSTVEIYGKRVTYILL